MTDEASFCGALGRRLVCRVDRLAKPLLEAGWEVFETPTDTDGQLGIPSSTASSETPSGSSLSTTSLVTWPCGPMTMNETVEPAEALVLAGGDERRGVSTGV